MISMTVSVQNQTFWEPAVLDVDTGMIAMIHVEITLFQMVHKLQLAGEPGTWNRGGRVDAGRLVSKTHILGNYQKSLAKFYFGS
jgi:hypothetical protein